MSRAARVLMMGAALGAAATLAACHVSVKTKSGSSDTAGSTAPSSSAAPSTGSSAAPSGAPSGAPSAGATSGAIATKGIFEGASPLTLRAIVTKGAEGIEVFAKLTIHGKPYYFNVDSGASTTSIDPTIAKKIGLKTVGAGPTLQTIGCKVKTTIVQLDDWALGAKKLPASKLVGQPNQYTKVKFGGIPVVGQLGSDLQSLTGRVRIDYKAKKVTFAASAPSGGKTVPLKFLTSQQGLAAAVLAPVTIGSKPYVMQVDTGASHTTLSAPVATQLHLPKIGKPVKVTAISCTTMVQEVKLSGVKIGGIAAPATVAATSSGASPNGGQIAGLFGSDLLASYGTVTIDYSAGKLALGA